MHDDNPIASKHWHWGGAKNAWINAVTLATSVVLGHAESTELESTPLRHLPFTESMGHLIFTPNPPLLYMP